MWNESDFEKKIWKALAERMKGKREHIVPLSRQAIEIFQSMKKISGGYELVFPGTVSKSRPITDAALLKALRRLGYSKDKMTIHGFRSGFDTMLNEPGYNSDHIEAQLAHVDKNTVRRAYNRTDWLKDRVKLVQEWADYIYTLKEKARTWVK